MMSMMQKHRHKTPPTKPNITIIRATITMATTQNLTQRTIITAKMQIAIINKIVHKTPTKIIIMAPQIITKHIKMQFRMKVPIQSKVLAIFRELIGKTSSASIAKLLIQKLHLLIMESSSALTAVQPIKVLVNISLR